MTIDKITTQKLRDRISEIEIPPESEPPYWDYWRADLRNHILTDIPENYTSWPIIRHTMLMDHLCIDSSWRIISRNITRYKNAIAPPAVGKPDWYNGYSRVMIEQAAHIAQWEQKSGRTVDELDSILEFGAGYGTMPLLLSRLGFTGRYSIIDLPEMCIFQEWFLSCHGLDAQFYTSPDNLPGVKGRETYRSDMLIAIGSISETPMEFRKQFFSRTSTDNFIFRFSAQWANYNNAAYFAKMQKIRSDLKWYEWEAIGWVNTSLVGWL